MGTTTAQALDRRDPLPLWAQLQRDITRRLAAGAFSETFPGEVDLTREYDVSRHTVREALRRLREAGVLDSARGRPTSVRGPVRRPLGTYAALLHALAREGAVVTAAVVSQGFVKDAEAAAALGVPGTARLVHVERVRHAGGVPLAHERSWLPASVAAPLARADVSGSLTDALVARCDAPVDAVRERVGATTTTAALRSLLAVPRGVACLTLERTARAAGVVVEHRVAVVRGDRWSPAVDWTSRGGTAEG